MLDSLNACALLWAWVRCVRARARVETLLVLVASYVLGLELASGLVTLRGGTLDPMFLGSILSVVLSGLPRGALPAWPLAAEVVGRPWIVDLTLSVALLGPFVALSKRTRDLPDEGVVAQRITRAALALVVLTMFAWLHTVIGGAWALSGDD